MMVHKRHGESWAQKGGFGRSQPGRARILRGQLHQSDLRACSILQVSIQSQQLLAAAKLFVFQEAQVAQHNLSELAKLRRLL